VPDGKDTNVTTTLATSALPLVRFGEKSEVVRAVQALLIMRGASCGMWGADGEFGNATRAAVLAFQRRNGLEADGVVGPQTWAKLLGVRT
jgi:peptidoglycan hydrolase-like protein with peptidoglycan-binding domain